MDVTLWGKYNNLGVDFDEKTEAASLVEWLRLLPVSALISPRPDSKRHAEYDKSSLCTGVECFRDVMYEQILIVCDDVRHWQDRMGGD